MAPPLAQSVREGILEYFAQCRATEWIMYIIGVSRSQINRMRNNWHEYGDVVSQAKKIQGRPRRMNRENGVRSS